MDCDSDYRPLVAILLAAGMISRIRIVLPNWNRISFGNGRRKYRRIMLHDRVPRLTKQTGRSGRWRNPSFTCPRFPGIHRRTGTQSGFFITEPNTGDYLIQLEKDRNRTTDEVIADIRKQIECTQPALRIDFGQVIGDMLGDLMTPVQPIAVKILAMMVYLLKVFLADSSLLTVKYPEQPMFLTAGHRRTVPLTPFRNLINYYNLGSARLPFNTNPD